MIEDDSVFVKHEAVDIAVKLGLAIPDNTDVLRARLVLAIERAFAEEGKKVMVVTQADITAEMQVEVVKSLIRDYGRHERRAERNDQITQQTRARHHRHELELILAELKADYGIE
jgi:hypothetical protein